MRSYKKIHRILGIVSCSILQSFANELSDTGAHGHVRNIEPSREYVIDVIFSPEEQVVYSYNISVRGSVTKNYDAILKFTTGFDGEGEEKCFDEVGLGYFFSATNLVVFGDKAIFDCNIGSRAIEGWQCYDVSSRTYGESGKVRIPIVTKKTYHGTLEILFGEWKQLPVSSGETFVFKIRCRKKSEEEREESGQSLNLDVSD